MGAAAKYTSEPKADLRIVQSREEYFETYEQYMQHISEMRNYLRSLPDNKWIRFDSIPGMYRNDAIRHIIEHNWAEINQQATEFIIILKYLI